MLFAFRPDFISLWTLLASNCLDRTTKGYPLTIDATEVILEESPVNTELLLKLLPKLEYSAIRQACQQLAPTCQAAGIDLPTLPETLPDSLLTNQPTATINSSAAAPTTAGDTSENCGEDERLLADLHRVLFDIHVQEGSLVCPDTGRKFPVKQGIPNMVLHEDEI